MASDNRDPDFPEDDFDRRVQALGAPELFGDLLERCLATIPRGGSIAGQAGGPRAPVRHRRRILVSAVAAAAAVVLICLVLVRGLFEPTDVLAEVNRAWAQAGAYHFTRIQFAPDGQAVLSSEVWGLQGVGRREEVRRRGSLTAVIVDNARWRFHYDVAGGLVAAWPTRLGDRSHPVIDDYVLSERPQTWIEWGERKKAAVVLGKDRLDGRDVLTIAATWPGGSAMGTSVVWFDPATHRPLKSRYENAEGHAFETAIDYPAPDSLPAARFTFRVPREVLLEVNDPQLGRQIYSEGQKGPDLRE